LAEAISRKRTFKLSSDRTLVLFAAPPFRLST